MGNFTTVFGIWILVSALMCIYQETLSTIDPLLSTAGNLQIATQLIGKELSRSNVDGSLTFNNSVQGARPEQQTTGTSSSLTQFPDWVQSVNKWIDNLSIVINFVGAPYFLFTFMGLGSIGAVFGAMLSILNMVLFVSWLTGRVG